VAGRFLSLCIGVSRSLTPCGDHTREDAHSTPQFGVLPKLATLASRHTRVKLPIRFVSDFASCVTSSNSQLRNLFWILC
jgi:hypothetical protein